MTQTIVLTQGFVTLVDDTDYDWLNQFKWRYINGYAYRTIGPRNSRKTVGMHNVILGINYGADHIDRNGLNNRRHNLRVANRSLQGHNRLMPKRTLPRGVQLNGNRYSAYIKVNGKTVYLGRYDTPEEAHSAYLFKCFEVHGEHPPE